MIIKVMTGVIVTLVLALTIIGNMYVDTLERYGAVSAQMVTCTKINNSNNKKLELLAEDIKSLDFLYSSQLSNVTNANVEYQKDIAILNTIYRGARANSKSCKGKLKQTQMKLLEYMDGVIPSVISDLLGEIDIQVEVVK